MEQQNIYVQLYRPSLSTRTQTLSSFLKFLKLSDDIIEKEESGRPFLKKAHQIGWDLSLAHSHDIELMALTQNQKIGVDFEVIQEIALFPSLTTLILSEKELLEFQMSASPLEFFYTVWTQKEAISKALGMGLTLPFCQFSASHAAEDLLKMGLFPKNALLNQEHYFLNIPSPTIISIASIFKEPNKPRVVICQNC